MSPTLIAALVAAQAPTHATCRAQDFESFDGIDSTMVVRCSCNVRLTLSVPRTVEASPAPVKSAKKGEVDDA